MRVRVAFLALQKRDHEPDINCLTSSGLPAPLGTINRKPKQETFGLIPDDGFVSEVKGHREPPGRFAATIRMYV